MSKNRPAPLVAHVGAVNLTVVCDGRRRLYISSRSSRGRFKNEHARCSMEEVGAIEKVAARREFGALRAT